MSLTTATAVKLGIDAISAVGSFRNAAQTDDLLEQSNKAATEYLESAKSRIEKDFYAGLNVPTSAFEAELLSNLQATTTAVEALSEAGSRELIGGVGKIQSVQQQGAEAARIKQEQEMFELEKFKAGKRDEMNQQMLQLETTAERDRQKRIRDAEQDRATLMTQGFSTLASGATTILEQSDLYKKSKDDRQLAKFLKENNISMGEYTADPAKFADDFMIYKMNDKEFKAYEERKRKEDYENSEDKEKAQKNFYATEEGQRQLGIQADAELRKKQYEEQMAAVGSLTDVPGLIPVQQSPLMQSLFPSFEETMAKYGITLPEQPKTYTTI